MEKFDVKVLTEEELSSYDMNVTYSYVYKTTNIINNKFYIGVHSGKLNDNYFGSGSYLINAINKYGVSSFKKEIVRVFDNSDFGKYKAYLLEKEIITPEILKQFSGSIIYNLSTGGDGGWKLTMGKSTYVDEAGNTFWLSNTDPRVLSGEFKSFVTGKVKIRLPDNSVIEVPVEEKYLYEDGKFVTEGFAVYRKASDEFSTDDLEYLSINDPKVLSGEYVFFMKGSALYKNNKTNEVHRLSPNDHRILSGEYSHLSKGKTLVRNTKTGEVSMGELRDDTSNFESIHKGTFLYKDLSGNLLRADTTDPKVLSGELIPFNKGTMFYFKKDDSERKLVRLSIDDPRVLSGEYQFILSGKTKIHNKLLKQEKVF